MAAVAGFILPDIWLGRRIKARQQILRLALPDALDLLVICMEAGLGLDQALLYVGQELRIAHPELCEEFDMVNAEMHVGKTRMDALRSLATRTGVEDLQALVATLVQTDRFGTSVAQSLRIHSDDLRTKRRQRAEEMAAKTTVKMVFPLVFFIFPALFVVILGPGSDHHDAHLVAPEMMARLCGMAALYFPKHGGSMVRISRGGLRWIHI